jgi:hypothetical protein
MFELLGAIESQDDLRGSNNGISKTANPGKSK